MESSTSFPVWQAISLSSLLTWVIASSLLDLTPRIRSLIRPWISRRVQSDTPFILHIQRYHHVYLDNLFSVLSCIVSVPFYTGFLPLLFWSGHSRLARQMTLLVALCDYIGNLIKDMISAPRPSCPPVRRVTATKDEIENAMEYGLPSSHALNTICLSGYMLHYVITYGLEGDRTKIFIGFTLVSILVLLIGIGRIYLGMHSLIDVVAGTVLGIVVLSFWLMFHTQIDDFIISEQNVTSFWAGFSFLICFAYPTPEFPTPSFEYHAAFTGVAFGIEERSNLGKERDEAVVTAGGRERKWWSVKAGNGSIDDDEGMQRFDWRRRRQATVRLALVGDGEGSGSIADGGVKIDW